MKLAKTLGRGLAASGIGEERESAAPAAAARTRAVGAAGAWLAVAFVGALPGCSLTHGVDPPPPPDAQAEASAADRSPSERGTAVVSLDPATASLSDAVGWLSEHAAALSPGTELSISVRDLETGEHASVAGDELHVSASTAKPLWVAAALDSADIQAVEGLALPIFERSDNDAAGAVIDLLGPSPIGPNRINAYLWDQVGMANTALVRWSFGGTARVATNAPIEMGDDNYVTADDLITFFRHLEAEQIVRGHAGALLRRWLTQTPRTGFAGWLGAQLPEGARRTMMHKAGWLVPGCCDADERYNTLNDAGIVEAPGHHRYAVAILSRRGEDFWGRQVGLVELASCLIYHTVARDHQRCALPGNADPR